jgi:hypothetical protein
MHDSTGASSSIKSDLQSGATENEENTLVNTVPEVTSTQDSLVLEPSFLLYRISIREQEEILL